MDSIEVYSRTQRLVVGPPASINLTGDGQAVNPTTVRVVSGGAVGPPGVQGAQGPPGEDANTSVATVMAEHVQSPTPHPVYDDMVDLTILLENGLY